MRPGHSGATLRAMPLWAVTIVVLAVVWAVGSILVALGARRLIHTQPD